MKTLYSQFLIILCTFPTVPTYIVPKIIAPRKRNWCYERTRIFLFLLSGDYSLRGGGYFPTSLCLGDKTSARMRGWHWSGYDGSIWNVQEIHQDTNLTKDAARTHVARYRRRQLVPDTWPRDLMQCLVLLRETQKEEIAPDKKPVSGYIQVRLPLLVFPYAIVLVLILRIVICDSTRIDIHEEYQILC